jgi:hypothetical protein
VNSELIASGRVVLTYRVTAPTPAYAR